MTAATLDRTAAQHWIPAAIALAFAAVIAAILVTPVPPLLDYPNHLVRFWLLAGGKHVWPLPDMYRIDWSLASTNIGLDLAVDLLAKALPYGLVVKLILIAVMAGPSAGAVLLSRVVFGRWGWWQVTLPLLTWTTTALFGFLSYQVALALALLFACLEPALVQRPAVGAIVRVLAGAAILVFHPFGLLFYAALIMALAIGPSWQGLLDKARLTRVAWGVVVSLLVVLIPLVTLLALSHTLPGANAHKHGAMIEWSRFKPYFLILTLASPFLSYKIAIDLLFIAPVFAVCLWAFLTRRLNSHAGLIIIGAGTAALSLFMPFGIGDAAWLTRRLPLMAALMLGAGVLPDPWPAAVGRRVLTTLALLLALGRTAWIGQIWLARTRDVRSIEAAFRSVPAGSAVFAVQSEPASLRREPAGRFLAGIPEYKTESTLRHMPALVVVERHAFIPTLFTVPGQQPLRVLPPWNSLAVSSSLVPDVHVLDRTPTAGELDKDPYIAHWRDRFDYIIQIGADEQDKSGRFNPPPDLKLVADERYARLYQVVRDRTASR